MSDDIKKQLIKKFGKFNFGEKVELKRGSKCKPMPDNKPISAFGMARRV